MSQIWNFRENSTAGLLVNFNRRCVQIILGGHHGFSGREVTGRGCSSPCCRWAVLVNTREWYVWILALPRPLFKPRMDSGIGGAGEQQQRIQGRTSQI